MKAFKLKKEDIKNLITWKGPEGCMATDRITVDGCKIGYMYREEPDSNYPGSGWRFFEGTENEAYMNEIKNSGVYKLNTICNYDTSIIPFLNSPIGSAFYKDENGEFKPEKLNIK